ncbi:hypothetical protein L3Q82_024152 [Scortum barcoo]|uniref:Uncharacterized protein n=1 Tax=Scortum barcoo TaxID=214431 RepID=A0ACB8WUT6_9TELE|nr:hypothetical protein L3Q82_024152 [Scortum barcoo]
MATLFDGISQQLDFTSCGEEGSSSDNSSDDCTFRIHSPRIQSRIRSPGIQSRIRSPGIRSPRIRSPSSACRTPRVQRHRSRSDALSSPLQCTSPIPSASWRKLRLCDSPSTPKSLLSKSSQPCSSTKIGRHQKILRPSSVATNLIQVPSVNVNPFTPDTVRRNSEQQWRNSCDDDDDYGRRTAHITKKLCSYMLKHSITSSEEDDEAFLPPKRRAVQAFMLSRYESEFLELECIGVGEFGAVYKCVKRLDGCLYAIKRSRRPLAGSANERCMHMLFLGTTHTLYAIILHGQKTSHMIIQNEYCDGGSLSDAIVKKEVRGELFSEAELKDLLLQVSMGLKYIHSSGLVHLDIKPSNIFICPRPSRGTAGEGESEEEEDGSTSAGVIYKIGDLGHVTSTSSPQVEEGDSRFLAREVLHEDYSQLPKADIFALGLTVLLAAGAAPLPQNGEEWHMLREGQLPKLPQELSLPFRGLLQLLLDLDLTKRPSARELCKHTVLREERAGRLAAQLRKELNVEKFRTAMLEKELQEARQAALSPRQSVPPGLNAPAQMGSLPRTGRRLVGRKTADCGSAECRNELLSLGQEINLGRTWDINRNGPQPGRDPPEDGDLECDGHLCLSAQIGDIQPSVELRRPGNHAEAAAYQQVAEELRQIAAQLEHNMVARATQNLSRNIAASPSEVGSHLRREVERVMTQGVGLDNLPQERVIMALTLTLVKGICEQTPQLLRSLFRTALCYITPAWSR